MATNMQMFDELEWAADFFNDRIGLARDKSGPRRWISAKTTDPSELRRFQAIVKLGKVYGPYDKPGKASGYIFETHTLGDAQTLARLLWPYLSPVRREEAQKVLARVLPKREVTQRRQGPTPENPRDLREPADFPAIQRRRRRGESYADLAAAYRTTEERIRRIVREGK